MTTIPTVLYYILLLLAGMGVYDVIPPVKDGLLWLWKKLRRQHKEE